MYNRVNKVYPAERLRLVSPKKHSITPRLGYPLNPKPYKDPYNEAQEGRATPVK